MMNYITMAIAGALIGAVIGGVYQAIKNRKNNH